MIWRTWPEQKPPEHGNYQTKVAGSMTYYKGEDKWAIDYSWIEWLDESESAFYEMLRKRGVYLPGDEVL